MQLIFFHCSKEDSVNTHLCCYLDSGGGSTAQVCRINGITVTLYSKAVELTSYFHDEGLMPSGTVKMETLTALIPLSLGLQVTFLSQSIMDSQCV